MPSTTSELIRAGARGLGREPTTLLSAAALVTIGGAVSWLLPTLEEELVLLSLPWDVLVGWALAGSFSWLALRASRQGSVTIADLLHAFRTPGRWLWNVLVSLIVLLAILLGSTLLFLPGVYLALRLTFAQLVVNEAGAGPVEAIAESWRLTRGRELDVLALALVSGALLTAGFLCFVVGVIPAAAVTAVAWGRLFDELRQEQTTG